MISPNDCDICGGSRKIELPVIPKFVVTEKEPGHTVGATITCGTREFPCPQCQRYAAEDRVRIYETTHRMRIYETTHRMPGHLLSPNEVAERGAKRSIARQIGDAMLADGMIRFDWREVPEIREKYLKAKTAVVSPSVVASIEERSKDLAEKFARFVVNSAVNEIALWDAENSGIRGPITKPDAIVAVKAALERCLANRPPAEVLEE